MNMNEKYLILKQNSRYMTVRDQFSEGVKVRPHRLKGITKAAVIKDQQIVVVYQLNTNCLQYNAETGRIDINSLLDQQDMHSELINKHVVYETSSPATIKNPYDILVTNDTN